MAGFIFKSIYINNRKHVSVNEKFSIYNNLVYNNRGVLKYCMYKLETHSKSFNEIKGYQFYSFFSYCDFQIIYAIDVVVSFFMLKLRLKMWLGLFTVLFFNTVVTKETIFVLTTMYSNEKL